MRQLLLPALVRKSNAMARAQLDSQGTFEQRLIALVASRIHPADADFQTYSIPIQELMGESEYRGGENRKRLKALAEKMTKTGCKIEEVDGSTSYYALFSKCRLPLGLAAFEVQFHPDLKPHFLDLRKTLFTQYNLLEFMSLGSAYSQRLFEILKSWDDKPEVTFSIDDLQEILDVPPSLKKDFKALRIRVLEPAHAEIKTKTSLKYEWAPVRLQVSKAGEKVKWARKVTAVRFTFSKARVEEQEKEKKTEENTKTHFKNLKIFEEVKECWGKKGGDCKKNQSKNHCSLCQDLYPRQLAFPDLTVPA